MLGEERHWTRQPISELAIASGEELARSLAEFVLQHSQVGGAIERYQFLETVIDTLQEGVVTTHEGEIVLWNKGAQQLFGFLPNEVIGRQIIEILPGAPAELTVHRDGADAATSIESIKWSMSTLGGRELTIACTIIQLPLYARDRSTTVYVFHEVARAVSLEYLKDQLLSHVSHELRAPLNGIYGFGRLLLERPHMSDRQRAEALESLQHSIDRLKRLTGDFIDVMQARQQTLPVEFMPVDLIALIRVELRDYRLRFPEHRMVFRAAPDLPSVWGDAMRIKQVLDNLVSNAAKYSQPGSRIAINVRETKGMASISVVDQGSGISKDAMEQIFQPFFRTDEARRQATGVGLGLSIVQSLVQAHQGDVRVESKVGTGSKFTFTLPLYQPVAVDTEQTKG